MKSWLVALFIGAAVSLAADATFSIKGKNPDTSIRIADRSGSCRIRGLNNTTTVEIRPRRQFRTIKLSFRVLRDDEFSFSIAGEYSKDTKMKRQFFEWVDFAEVKVNGQVLLGPGAKDKKMSQLVTLSKSMALPGSVKVKRGDTLKVELKLRATPRAEARKRSTEANLSARQKARLEKRSKREEERQKQIEAERKAEDEAAERAKKAEAAEKAGQASKAPVKRFGNIIIK